MYECKECVVLARKYLARKENEMSQALQWNAERNQGANGMI